MITEVASYFGIAAGVVASLTLSKRPVLLRRVTTVLVAAGLFDWVMLSVSGFARDGAGLAADTHAVAGHILLPLLAPAMGHMFATSLRRGPLPVVSRLLFMTVLGFLCLSNTWTGYLGPTRIDPRLDPDTYVRFRVVHSCVVPILIGLMLLWWLVRLLRSGGDRSEPGPS